jgi:hypothetical protein
MAMDKVRRVLQNTDPRTTKLTGPSFIPSSVKSFTAPVSVARDIDVRSKK